MSFTVRPARPADLPQITAIYAQHVLHGLASFELTPPDLTEMTRRFEGLEADGLPYFVAEDSGEGGTGVLGYAYAGYYRPRPGYRFCVEDSVYVDPGATGQGVGKALLEALIETATAMGFRKMVAIIGDSANAASIGLHASHGFLLAGTLRSIGFKHGQWVDSVLMERFLGEGDDSLPSAEPDTRR